METIKGKVSFWILNGTISGLFIFTELYFTAGKNSLLLWKLQDLDLFITTRKYFLESVLSYGGGSVYISTFLNQFFYQPQTGSVIYLLALLIVAYLTYRAFNLKGNKFALSLIPSLALLLATTELGYMIYILKLDGFIYLGVIGLIGILGGVLIFKRMKSPLSQSVFIFFYLLVVYPITGAYALFGALLLMLHALKQAMILKDMKKLIPAAVALSGIFLVTGFYYLFVSWHLPYQGLFLINLPDFLWEGPERKLWIPYISIAIILIIVLIVSKEEHSEVKFSFLRSALPVIAFLACIAGVVIYSYEDHNFNTELAMIHASEKGEWDKVLELSKANKLEPTRLMVMNTQLAYFKLGKSEEIYRIKDGNKAINSPREILPINIAGIFFYYQYGKMNYCYKWCMENMVELGMNTSVLKYFVLSSMLNGEYNLARKYNDVLKSTIFHKSWALKQEAYINDPGKIATAPEFKNLLPLLAYSNSLEGDQNMLEDYLKTSFASIHSDSSALLELSIHSSLNMKSISRFWPKFNQWVSTHKKIPVRFQEAALLFQQIEKKENTEGIPYDIEVLDNFQRFMAFVKKYEGYSNESVQGLYYKQFGGTYWYYFFYAKNHATSTEKSKS